MKKKFTGLLDRNCEKIYEGDLIRAGMRRGNPNGWSSNERVVRRHRKFIDFFTKQKSDEWFLENSIGERMQMQWDQELRELQK